MPAVARKSIRAARAAVCDYVLWGSGGSLKAEGLGDGWTSAAGKFPFTGPAIPKLRLRLPPGADAQTVRGTQREQ
jgi:hypothetical protein